jgi:hypothetical protein
MSKGFNAEFGLQYLSLLVIRIRIWKLVIFPATQSANGLVPLIQAANSCRTPGDLAH